MWNSGTSYLLFRCPIIEKRLSLLNSVWLTFWNSWLDDSSCCLVAWHFKYVSWSALGEVRLWLVDLRLHHDGTLPTIHAALNGAYDIHLELPLFTKKKRRKGERLDQENKKDPWTLVHSIRWMCQLLWVDNLYLTSAQNMENTQRAPRVCRSSLQTITISYMICKYVTATTLDVWMYGGCANPSTSGLPIRLANNQQQKKPC